MSERRLSRRSLLKALAGVGAGLLATPVLAACQPQVVKETVVVEKNVEKVVQQTVIVEKSKEVPTVRVMTRPGPLGIFMSEFAKRYELAIDVKIDYQLQPTDFKLLTEAL